MSLTSPLSNRLFDMDGTLVDSTDGVVGAWELFKEKYPQLDVTEVLSGKVDYLHDSQKIDEVLRSLQYPMACAL